MITVLSIDPGSEESAYTLIEGDALRPTVIGKVPNEQMLEGIVAIPYIDLIAIEMVASYGMPVGKEVFDTCVWVGRFQQRILDSGITRHVANPVELVYRREVKLHHCEDSRAKDGNIIQALVDRFAPGEKNRGKGTKSSPGWFYGFADDIWQAYALGVYAAEKLL